jgi:hypothetical protein
MFVRYQPVAFARSLPLIAQTRRLSLACCSLWPTSVRCEMVKKARAWPQTLWYWTACRSRCTSCRAKSLRTSARWTTSSGLQTVQCRIHVYGQQTDNRQTTDHRPQTLVLPVVLTGPGLVSRTTECPGAPWSLFCAVVLCQNTWIRLWRVWRAAC